MTEECVTSFDNLQQILRAVLTTKIGDLGVRRHENRAAVESMTDC